MNVVAAFSLDGRRRSGGLLSTAPTSTSTSSSATPPSEDFQHQAAWVFAAAANVPCLATVVAAARYVQPGDDEATRAKDEANANGENAAEGDRLPEKGIGQRQRQRDALLVCGLDKEAPVSASPLECCRPCWFPPALPAGVAAAEEEEEREDTREDSSLGERIVAGCSWNVASSPSVNAVEEEELPSEADPAPEVERLPAAAADPEAAPAPPPPSIEEEDREAARTFQRAIRQEEEEEEDKIRAQQQQQKEDYLAAAAAAAALAREASAALKIQTAWRTSSSRTSFHRYLRAVRLVQGAVRRYQRDRKRKDIIASNAAATKIQAAWRAASCRTSFLRYLWAARLIQRAASDRRQRDGKGKEIASAVLALQKHCRAFVARRKLKDLQAENEARAAAAVAAAAAATIQRTWQKKVALRRALSLRRERAATIVQRAARGRLERRRLGSARFAAAAVAAQRRVRGRLARRRAEALRSEGRAAAAVKIQGAWRRRASGRAALLLRREAAARSIQSMVRDGKALRKARSSPVDELTRPKKEPPNNGRFCSPRRRIEEDAFVSRPWRRDIILHQVDSNDSSSNSCCYLDSSFSVDSSVAEEGGDGGKRLFFFSTDDPSFSESGGTCEELAKLYLPLAESRWRSSRRSGGGRRTLQLHSRPPSSVQ